VWAALRQQVPNQQIMPSSLRPRNRCTRACSATGAGSARLWETVSGRRGGPITTCAGRATRSRGLQPGGPTAA
jgi:hypothetical protein